MASIIEGFSYDIFISYRQKDNKGDRWVSEFVSALKDELEATFKEDISIYFDENPHDGLLETHDVDASLKEKMRCLVFIPIISRTYCDPKAFAWEHEFLAFIKQASVDQFGLKVTLPNGNVATRVLPVRIHDLSVEDTRLVESVLGGMMRGVDFIYKSPGVNRPLRANEDHPQDNQNRTYYRDQINKVANAINDIIYSLKYGNSGKSEKTPESFAGGIKRKNKPGSKIRWSASGIKFKRRSFILLFIPVLVFIIFAVYKSSYNKKTETTFAFIRLQNLNNDSTLINDAANFIESINGKLTQLNSVKVVPILRDQYKDTRKSLDEIRRELSTNFILEGDIRRENQEIKISITLSAARRKELLMTKLITWERNNATKIILETVGALLNKMAVKISPEEELLIRNEPSVNPEVNFNFTAANIRLKDAWDYYNYRDKLLDSVSFNSAVEAYTKVLEKDTTIAEAYAKRAIARTFGIYLKQLDSSTIEKCRADIRNARFYDKELPDINIAQGFYYYYCEEEYDSALVYFSRASEIRPDDYRTVFYMALVQRRLGNWAECLRLIHTVIKYNPKESLFLTNIGMTYAFYHMFDSALIYHQKAIDQIPYWAAGYKNKYEVLILKNGPTKKSQAVIDDAIKMTGDNMVKYSVLQLMYQKKYQDALALADGANSNDFDFDGEKYLLMGILNNALNNPSGAIQNYERARLILIQAAKKNPRDAYTLGALGLSYAGLGQKQKAKEVGERAAQIASEKNKMDESDIKKNLAQIYTMTGDYNSAFSIVTFLLNDKSFLSKELLEHDPVWKPLLESPEYKKKF